MTATRCASYERSVEVPLSSCCTTMRCECDQSLCPVEHVDCNANQHVEYVNANSCCKQAICVCDECPVVTTVCKDGWITIDETDSCGCKSSELYVLLM